MLTTENKELANEILSYKADGIKIRKLIQFFDAAPDPEQTKIIAKTIDLAIHYSGEAALIVFATWLNNKFKNKDTKNTRINGIEISGKNNNVNIVISTCMGKNENQSEKEIE
jgi:protein involved in sex pheromone biosynthesis